MPAWACLGELSVSTLPASIVWAACAREHGSDRRLRLAYCLLSFPPPMGPSDRKHVGSVTQGWDTGNTRQMVWFGSQDEAFA